MYHFIGKSEHPKQQKQQKQRGFCQVSLAPTNGKLASGHGPANTTWVDGEDVTRSAGQGNPLSIYEPQGPE
jgi:hypothetical protein